MLQVAMWRCIYKVKVTEKVAQYPLHYVNYALVKFEIALSNS